MMPDTKVSPTLWACLQIGEIDQLKNLVKLAPLMADWISYVSDTIKELPLLWSQQVAPSSCKSSQIGSSKGKTADKSELKRSAKQQKLCLERDGRKCVVTGNSHPDFAHVSPFCMLKWKNSPLEQRLEGFWKLLSLFWPRDKINSWKAKVFSGEEGPDTCRNMICLEPTAHRLWTKGLFAFKPVKTSDDPSVLSLLFVWQPKYDHRKDDHIDIMDKPKSCKGLTGSSDWWLYLGSSKRVETGDIFQIRSDNIDTHPLPDFEILEMQWALQRLVSMSGAAGWVDLEDRDSDSTLNGDECLFDRQTISKWVTDTGAYKSDQYSPFGDLEERPGGMVSVC
jgi:hypothetical protein